MFEKKKVSTWNENKRKLAATTETQHQGESGLLLDAVVRQSAAIFELLASKGKTLLIWGNALFILNFGLHIFNSVWGLHFQSDGFASQGLHRDLHATSQTQNQMEGGLFLDVVVRQCDQRFPSPMADLQPGGLRLWPAWPSYTSRYSVAPIAKLCENRGYHEKVLLWTQ